MSNLDFHKKWFIDYFIQANKLAKTANKKIDYKDIVETARLSIEAIVKYIIYEKETVINQIIKKPLDKKIEFVADKQYLHLHDNNKNEALRIDFHRVRIGGNEGAHHLDKENQDVTKGDSDRVISILQYLSKWFFNDYLKEDIPEEVKQILDGKLETQKIQKENQDWHTFESECSLFNNKSQYILITSPNIKNNSSDNQLSLLGRVDWKLIVDFDDKSKEDGLYKFAQDEYKERSIQDLTIESKNNEFEQSKALTYWFFANGLYPSIKPQKNTFLWKAKYSLKLKTIVEEVIKKVNFHKTIIVCFWNDAEYLKAIFEAFYVFADAPEKLKVIIINDNKLNENEIEKTLKDEIEVFEISILNFKYSNLLEGFREIKSRVVPMNKSKITIPAFNNLREYSPIDLSSEYYYELKNRNGIELLHFDIANLYENESDDFYLGRTISWYDLSLYKGKDVERIKTATIIQDVRDAISENTGFYKIDLFHEPGAGGTTVARRVAYEIGVLSAENPTLVMTKFHPNRTFDAIRDIYNKVNQKAIFAVIEEWEFSEEKLKQLREQIIKARIHFVVLYVQRVFTGIKEKKYKRYLKPTLIEKDNKSEIKDFEYVYSKLKPERKTAIQAIPDLYKNEPKFITPFIYGLTAFQEDFLKLDDYIKNWLEVISSDEKRKFIGYISLINYYIQNEVNEISFLGLFEKEYIIEEETMVEDLFKLRDDKEYKALNVFLIQNYDLKSTIGGIERVPNGVWKTRHSIIARETIKQLLVGINGDKNKWKINLSTWLEELILLIKEENPLELCEPDRVLLEALFIDKQKQLANDTLDEEKIKPRRFAAVIEDLNEYNVSTAQQVLKTLAKTFPENPYFRQHLARHLYFNAENEFLERKKNYNDVIKDFEMAENEALAAVNTGNPKDPVLHHTLGDAILKQIKFIVKNYDKSGKTTAEIEHEIITENGLFERAQKAFNNSIENDEDSIFRYLSYIRLLTNVIDFGRKISEHEKFETFIKDEKYFWYSEKIEDALKTIEIAEINMDYYNSYDKVKYKEQLDNVKSYIYRLVGQSKKQQKQLLNLANSASTNQSRAFYKTSYVLSILNSKLEYSSKNFNTAWSNLTKSERDTIREQLEENMNLEPNNAFYSKMWLKTVRSPNYDVTIALCEKTFSRWYSNIETYFEDNNKILVEANYYLYVFNAIMLLNEGEQLTNTSLSKTEKYLDQSKEYSKKIQNLNDIFCFEWYGKQENGIDQIVSSHKLGNLESKYGFFKNVSLLKEVEGLIINVGSSAVEKEGKKRSEGEILLDVGLKAFFVPIYGGFYIDDEGKEMQASFSEKDEGKRVKFYLGFTYSRLQAWQVIPIDANRAIIEKTKQEKIETKTISVEKTIEYKVKNVNRQRNVLQGEIKNIEGWIEIPFNKKEYSKYRYSFGKTFNVKELENGKFEIIR